MEKLELLRTVGENIKWCSYYGKQYGSSSKIKNRILHDPASTSGNILQRTGKQEVKRYLYTHAHSNIIHNTQNDKATKYLSTDEEGTKYSTHHNGTSFSLKRKGVLDSLLHIHEPLKILW